jgi:hypothetical protein
MTANAEERAPESSTDRLEVIRLSWSEWRISDSRLPDSDPDRLLGYVERLSRRRYEVVWMTDPMRWGYAESLAAALAGLANGERFSGTTLAERDRALRGRPAFPLHRVHRRTVAKGGSHDEVA